MPDFDRLHGRCFDHLAVACAFDLLMLNGDDLRRKAFAERKAALRKLLKHEPDGIQCVERTEGDGDAMFEAVCKLGLEGIVSKKLTPPIAQGRRKVGSRSGTRRLRQRYALSRGASEAGSMQEGPLLGGPSNTSNSLLSVVAVAAIVRRVADVHPAVIRPPLDTVIVTVAVTAVVRRRGCQCETSA